ncbi:hypothetical protein WR25_14250 [Diploscapter pachys]|uniref:Uncharacterized protein n=1 Tax=Diploscapter pachys TaxID=2018661 RepID=A0A2A2M4H8_9BILA|nr:hypothetical protein WR25_14250 [Diploscapter pachys]
MASGAPVARRAAGLFEQADVRDRHRAIHRLRHVVDGEQGDRHGGQCLHLDAGLAVGGGQRGRGDAGIVQRQVERDAGEGQGVAERDEVRGFLRRHDPGDAGNGEHVALLRGAVADRREGVGGDGDAAGGDCATLRHGFIADIDHMRGTVDVEMGEVAHPTKARVAASTSSARISASPMRKQRTPCAAIASRSARVSRPLSATKVQPFGALPTSS